MALVSWVMFVRLFRAAVSPFVSLLFLSQLALAQFTQQGPKLVGNGADGIPHQGFSVALSADGNTAIVGAPGCGRIAPCEHDTGAAWVFTRSGDVWSQQGDKLVGSGAVETPDQGYSVAVYYSDWWGRR